MLVQPYDVPKVSSEWHVGENRPDLKAVRKPRKESKNERFPSCVIIDIDGGRPFY